MKTYFLLIAIVVNSVKISSVVGDNEADYRLSDDIRPERYRIKLITYLEDEGDKQEWTFDGSVKIKLRVFRAGIKSVVLHANELEIENIKLYNLRDPFKDLYSDREYDNETQKLSVKSVSVLSQNQDFILDINYKGVMADDMAGFYRSTYKENGQEKRLATTQFQATDARRAFPCFDEPKFKAVFKISIVHLNKYCAISNANVAQEVEIGNGRTLTIFHETPKMSTYLVAFVVSEFDNRYDGNFGVWARPDMYDQTEYPLQNGLVLLEYFNTYTEYPYYRTIDKMDQAAIPDFSGGAMENWGLLTYRESDFLYDRLKSTTYSEQRILAGIAHEQSHMWFGDLVTYDWWDYTWLSEGFATFYEYFATAAVFPETELDLQFVIEQLQEVFQTDSSNSTHPMNYNVNTPDEISSIFDDISYNKGGVIIRLIQHLIGFERFHKALKHYIRHNQYKTTVPEKLYSALQSFADESLNIAQIMGSWADQEGFPVLQVRVNSKRTQATISQKRFLTQNPDHEDNTLYQIPITFANKNGNGFDDTSAKTILTTVSDTIDVFSEDSWTIFNVQEVGFYRVNYDSASWRLIREALLKEDFDGIHVLNRAQIIDDSLNLARGGLLKYKTAFHILDYLDNEKHYIPWVALFEGLRYLKQRLGGQPQSYFPKYVLKKLSNIYDYLGFYGKETDSQIDGFNRLNVLYWACKYGHEDCIAKSLIEFRKAQQDDKYLVPSSIRQIVYCTGIQFGNQNDWEWLLKKYEGEQFASEQYIILSSLAYTTQEETLNKFLTLTLTDAVRIQDQFYAFESAYREDNVDLIWKYIENNFQYIIDSQGTGGLATFINDLARYFTSRRQVDTLLSFIEVNNGLLEDSIEDLQGAVNISNFELFWASKNVENIERILQDKLQ